MSPDETVTEFIHRMEARDVAAALELCTDDLLYENVPMPPALEGKQATLEFLGAFLGAASEVEWIVHRQAATGDVVLNERTDRFRFGETWIGVEVAGVFELRDGRIALWRDYFDGAAMTEALAALG